MAGFRSRNRHARPARAAGQRSQSIGIERRTCKHLRKLRGDAEEDARIAAAGGSAAPVARKKSAGPEGEEEEGEGPPLLLAERWDSVQDMTGWWMSEKLDGVRAYWDGKAFISRLGNPYHAPDWFTAGLPDTPLDGELWSGRKLFQRTVSIVRRQDRSDHWKEIRFLVFDGPAMDAPFEDRLARCREIVSRREACRASRPSSRSATTPGCPPGAPPLRRLRPSAASRTKGASGRSISPATRNDAAHSNPRLPSV
jgi:hypothetical protein